MRIPNCALIAVVTLAASGLFPFTPESRADFFKYRDSDGNLIITNRFEDVPPKYRKKVKVVWDKDLESKDSVARKRAADKERFEQEEAAQKARQAAEEKKMMPTKGKTLVIELDENTGQLIRRFE